MFWSVYTPNYDTSAHMQFSDYSQIPCALLTPRIVCMSSVYWWRQRQQLNFFLHAVLFHTLFLFVQHQFFVCVSLFCSSTRNKSSPLSALPWNLNWTWIILTPSSHWSRSNWPRTIRKWHCRTKPALSSFGSFRSVWFCFVTFHFVCIWSTERKCLLHWRCFLQEWKIFCIISRQVLVIIHLWHCGHRWEEMLWAVWPMERSDISAYNNV